MVINKGLGFPTTPTMHLDLHSAVTVADSFSIRLHLNTENPGISCALTTPMAGWEVKSLCNS